jgi:glycosyltransferase involved in cell wall biosynthesis
VAPEIRWEPDESDVARPCDIDGEDANTPIEHVHSKAGKQVVSIVIPTHNRCGLLARTLQSLSQTIVPPETSVDLVIVASACTDDTSKVISNARFGSAWDVRTIDEPLAGVSAARNSGLKAARADLIAFLDDDVWVEPDWLAALLHAADHLPAQVFAGRVTLEWDDRPSWTSPAVEHLLAANDHGLQVRELSGPRRLVGVNFAVRRSVIESVGAFSPALGRRGADLLSGAEAELAWRALANGHRVFYVPRMSVRHWISSERASIAHLKRLAVGRGRTRVALRRACRQPNALACARTSVRQAIQGIVREIDGWVHRDQAKRVAGSLLFQRGVATLSALWTQVFSSHA